MIEHITDLPASCLGMRVVGEFTIDDFVERIEPEVDLVVERNERLRLVLHLGAEFTGFGPGAWGELTDEIRHVRFHRGAVVTDHHHLASAINLMKWTLHGRVRTFRDAEFDEAVRWIQR